MKSVLTLFLWVFRSVGGKSLCSSNLDCECFALTSNATTGICALADLACSNVIRCNLDNITCSIPNTIFVNNTRCQQPVCYSLAFASTQLCPPQNFTTGSATVATTTTSSM
ncbi:unnamed protein product [Didymodactylos carnosus]|uniref:Uncharacterized protein n=1 Tax=Didymodactylos carnosus TaxID=1234261 RepID=A0A815BTR9_9BILA|nr:unnamed protein product [Didymodactylos carnosus]CAF4064026.1 unnamed protein product [Didymodactylos carnosus]